MDTNQPKSLHGLTEARFSFHAFLSPLNTVTQSHQMTSSYLNMSCSSLTLYRSLCSALPPSLEKAMAPHSSTLARKIPWSEEPGKLQSMGSRGVEHDWATSLSLFTFIHWRRKWQPTPVFLPGESQGCGSLVGCCLWGRIESDTTEATQQQQQQKLTQHCKATTLVKIDFKKAWVTIVGLPLMP